MMLVCMVPMPVAQMGNMTQFQAPADPNATWQFVQNGPTAAPAPQMLQHQVAGMHWSDHQQASASSGGGYQDGVVGDPSAGRFWSNTSRQRDSEAHAAGASQRSGGTAATPAPGSWDPAARQFVPTVPTGRFDPQAPVFVPGGEREAQDRSATAYAAANGAAAMGRKKDSQSKGRAPKEHR